MQMIIGSPSGNVNRKRLRHLTLRVAAFPFTAGSPLDGCHLPMTIIPIRCLLRSLTILGLRRHASLHLDGLEFTATVGHQHFPLHFHRVALAALGLLKLLD